MLGSYLKNDRFSTEPVLLQLVVVVWPSRIPFIVGPYWAYVGFEVCPLWPLSWQKMFSTKLLLVCNGDIADPGNREKAILHTSWKPIIIDEISNLSL